MARMISLNLGDSECLVWLTGGMGKVVPAVHWWAWAFLLTNCRLSLCGHPLLCRCPKCGGQEKVRFCWQSSAEGLVQRLSAVFAAVRSFWNSYFSGDLWFFGLHHVWGNTEDVKTGLNCIYTGKAGSCIIQVNEVKVGSLHVCVIST